MIRRPPRSTRTDTLFPYTTLFRSCSAPLRVVPGRGIAPQRLVYALLIHLDPHAGPLLLEQHGAARIAFAPAAVQRPGHLLQSEVGHAHGYVQFAAEGGGEGHVLVREAGGEERRGV